MTDKAQTFSAFAHAFVDCLLLFSKRLRSSAPNVVRSLVASDPQADGADSEHLSGTILRDFVRKQTTRFSEETFQGRLQFEPPAGAESLSEVVVKLNEVDEGMIYVWIPRLFTDSRWKQIYRKPLGTLFRTAISKCYDPHPNRSTSGASNTSNTSRTLLSA